MTGSTPENPQPTTGEETLIDSSALDYTIKEERHGQTLKERRQRVRIGEKVAGIVIRFPLVILVLFWVFFAWLWFYSSDYIEKISTLLAVMFSVTHICAAVLYYALIRSMFQKIEENGADKAKKTDAAGEQPYNLPGMAADEMASEGVSAIKDTVQGP